MRHAPLLLALAVVPAVLSCGRSGAEKPQTLYPGDADALLGSGPPRASFHPDGPEPGYTFLSPLKSTSSYLLDLEGTVLHEWKGAFEPGAATYLLDDGSVLRCNRVPDPPVFWGGGQGGRIQRIAWDGTVSWDFSFATSEHLCHHDARLMPNGHVLLIAWEKKTREQAVAAGRDPSRLVEEGLWPDVLYEIEPLPPDGGRIVWEWHTWDHLIQDFDASKANYGDVAAHPELVDLNGDRPRQAPDRAKEEEDAKRLAELGYGAAPPPSSEGAPAPGEKPRSPVSEADWMHTNAVDYHPKLDLIAISMRRFSEVWVIDHSTSTAQAAAHSGGRHGRGGDILYRWGNSEMSRAGKSEDQRLYGQHNVQWIADGSMGAGDFLVFSNGNGRPGSEYSSIEEWRMPVSADGHIGSGPAEALWRYQAPTPTDFYSSFISSVQRLPNGNTFICSGETGRLFEVTPEGRTVWEWTNTLGGEDPQAPDSRSGGPPLNPHALFRAQRIPAGHPGVARLQPR